MPRPDAPLSLLVQEFLDDEGSWLRRVAFLLTGSWVQADEAVQHVLTQLLRQSTDLSDGPAAMRAAWPALVAFLRDREVVPSPVPGAKVTSSTPHLLAGLTRLPLDERVALVLSHLARLDEATTARCLGLPAADLPGLLGRAVEHLQQVLASHGDHLRLDAQTRPDHGRWLPPSTTLEEADL